MQRAKHVGCDEVLAGAHADVRRMQRCGVHHSIRLADQRTHERAIREVAHLIGVRPLAQIHAEGVMPGAEQLARDLVAEES